MPASRLRNLLGIIFLLSVGACLFVYFNCYPGGSAFGAHPVEVDGWVRAVIASPSSTCTPAWSIVSSPNPSRGDNYLFDVSAVSANDIWAVGLFDDTSGPSRTLMEHW